MYLVWVFARFRPKGLGPVYELKYAFLYGYNGTTFAIPGTSVGVHTGDLEHVTIRVDAGRRMWVYTFLPVWIDFERACQDPSPVHA